MNENVSGIMGNKMSKNLTCDWSTHMTFSQSQPGVKEEYHSLVLLQKFKQWIPKLGLFVFTHLKYFHCNRDVQLIWSSIAI